MVMVFKGYTDGHPIYFNLIEKKKLRLVVNLQLISAIRPLESPASRWFRK